MKVAINVGPTESKQLIRKNKYMNKTYSGTITMDDKVFGKVKVTPKGIYSAFGTYDIPEKTIWQKAKDKLNTFLGRPVQKSQLEILTDMKVVGQAGDKVIVSVK